MRADTETEQIQKLKIVSPNFKFDNSYLKKYINALNYLKKSSDEAKLIGPAKCSFTTEKIAS
jgi:hypothetical protein